MLAHLAQHDFFILLWMLFCQDAAGFQQMVLLLPLISSSVEERAISISVLVSNPKPNPGESIYHKM